MQEDAQFLRLMNFGKGLVRTKANPLAWPPDALSAGKNVVLGDGGFSARSGYSIVSDGSLPAGAVMVTLQSRFPTLATTKLVAQVKTSDPVVMWKDSTDGIPSYEHAVTWDAGRGRMWTYGGSRWGGSGTGHDLRYYTYDDETWTDATTAGSPGAGRYLGGMDYDPTRDCLYHVGGNIGSAEAPFDNDVYKYDCDAGTWSTLTTSGDGPSTDWYGYFVRYRATTDTLLVIPNRIDVVAFWYELNLTTNAWTRTAIAWSGSASGDMIDACTYCGNDDTVYAIFSNTTSRLAKLDLTTNEFSELLALDPDVVGETGFRFCSMAWSDYCSDTLVCGRLVAQDTGGDYWYFLSKYSITNNTMTYHHYPELPGADTETGDPSCNSYSLCVTDDGNVIRYGGALEPVDFSSCWVAGGCAAGAMNALFASDDHLPTTTATFEMIADLGETAGVISAAGLNDRYIFTEGIASYPLVWGGPMASDLSDGMFPKCVLITQDGEHFYDITQYVCDADPDLSANIAGIGPKGGVYIGFDQPQVSDVLIEFAVPNTGVVGSASTHTASIAFTERDDIEQPDLSDTITDWVEDTPGAGTGHFEDVATNPVTLGTGNTAPHVEVGCLVILADGTERTITAIVDDGEGADEVELSAGTATGDAGVSYIYGLNFISDGISPNFNVDATFTEIWGGSSYTPTSYASMANMSIRQVVDATEITASADYIRCTFEAPIDPVTLGLKLSYGSIGEQDSGANTTATPTQMRFDGAAGKTAVGYGSNVKENIRNWILDAADSSTYYGHFESDKRLFTTGPVTSEDAGVKTGFPVAKHNLTAGTSYITIYDNDTGNYSGCFLVDATSTDTKIIIERAYSAQNISQKSYYQQRMTLGTGNDCPDVTVGAKVTLYSGQTGIITAITSYGEQDAEVTLQNEQQSSTLSGYARLLYGVPATQIETGPIISIYQLNHTIVSDPFHFSIDETKSYVVCSDLPGV